jgi:hypothetical protein
MALRDNRYSPDNPYKTRENEQWELAGCAREDGDLAAAEVHIAKAREYAELARQWEA